MRGPRGVEPGVEADRRPSASGVIQREYGTSSESSGRSMPASSSSSRTAVAVVGVLAGMHRAAREDPSSAHEALLGVALDEQDLGAFR